MIIWLYIALNPGLPRPDFILQPWIFFLQGCEIKSERGRPGFEAKSGRDGIYFSRVPYL